QRADRKQIGRPIGLAVVAAFARQRPQVQQCYHILGAEHKLLPQESSASLREASVLLASRSEALLYGNNPRRSFSLATFCTPRHRAAVRFRRLRSRASLRTEW